MSSEILTHEVSVDYSQFYLLGRIASTDASKVASRDYGIVALDPLNYALFSTFTHHGELPITVSIHEKAPKVRKTFQDVVEFSIAVREPLALCGWGEEKEEGLQLPLEQGAVYRVRYSVKGADSSVNSPEEYRLDFWKASFDNFKVVSESETGGKLNLQAAAKNARALVNVLPKGERTEGIVRIALKERPEAAAAVAAGDDGAALDVILAYTNKIRPREFDYPTVPELIRELAGFQRDGILDSRSSSYVSELKEEDRGWFSKLAARLGIKSS